MVWSGPLPLTLSPRSLPFLWGSQRWILDPGDTVGLSYLELWLLAGLLVLRWCGLESQKGNSCPLLGFCLLGAVACWYQDFANVLLESLSWISFVDGFTSSLFVVAWWPGGGCGGHTVLLSE